VEGAADAAAVALVDPAEDVCRLCFSAEIPISRDRKHPNQVDPEDGYIRLEEIGWEDLKVRGFSVQRKALYSLAKALALAEARDAIRTAKGLDARYKFAGTLIARVQAVIDIVDGGGSSVFFVREMPLEDDPGHAEIRIAAHMTRQDFLKYRPALRLVLGRLHEPAVLDA
jgi:hypothetical protein